MIELSSVSNPAPTGLESATESTQISRIDREGSPGGASESSKSAEWFFAKGKSTTPLRQPESALESVIGVDERQRVFDTHLYPWRMICSLSIKAPNGGNFIGSGWFIGPKTIATAGHCVFDNIQMGGWASEIIVRPGRNESESVIPAFETTRFSATNVWTESRNPDFDIGCIHLDTEIGNETGWFAAASIPPSDLTDYLVNVAGYPGDLANGRRLYHHRNRVLHVGDRRMFYDVDTFGGQSGAPAFIFEDSAPDQPIAVGIHAYGVGGTPGSLQLTANSAPRLLPEVLDLFAKWTEDNS